MVSNDAACSLRRAVSIDAVETPHEIFSQASPLDCLASNMAAFASA
jgi:hypothetical protein